MGTLNITIELLALFVCCVLTVWWCTRRLRQAVEKIQTHNTDTAKKYPKIIYLDTLCSCCNKSMVIGRGSLKLGRLLYHCVDCNKTRATINTWEEE